MIGMFYSRKISTADRNQAIVYRKRMESQKDFTLNFWKDIPKEKQKPSDTIQCAVMDPTNLVRSIKTNLNMATVRFMRHMQELEIKYAHHLDDRILDLDMDGTMTFHLNNINNWHP